MLLCFPVRRTTRSCKGNTTAARPRSEARLSEAIRRCPRLVEVLSAEFVSAGGLVKKPAAEDGGTNWVLGLCLFGLQLSSWLAEESLHSCRGGPFFLVSTNACRLCAASGMHCATSVCKIWSPSETMPFGAKRKLHFLRPSAFPCRLQRHQIGR